MVEELKQYILTVAIVTIIGVLARLILPNGKTKDFALWGISIVTITVMIVPAISILKKGITLDNLAFVKDTSNEQINITTAKVIKDLLKGMKSFENADVIVNSKATRIVDITINKSANNGGVLEKLERDKQNNEAIKILKSIYNLPSSSIVINE